MPATLRDRFFTRRVANAITSPSAIMSCGAGAAIGVLVGGPLGAVVIGALGLAARVAVALPRAPKHDRIDASAVAEPWRSLVRDAQDARNQFDAAVRRALPGPLHDRLASIGEQISAGVDEAWRTAQSGNALGEAYGRIDTREITRDLDELGPTDTSPTVAATRAALLAQQETAERMATTLAGTRDQLRLLNAQLGEAVTRCIELSAGAYRPDDLDSLEGDVSHVLVSMEALRQALDATSEVAG